jgi:hypothetical protein
MDATRIIFGNNFIEKKLAKRLYNNLINGTPLDDGTR